MLSILKIPLVKNLHKNKLTLLLPSFILNNAIDWESLSVDNSIFT